VIEPHDGGAGTDRSVGQNRGRQSEVEIGAAALFLSCVCWG